jgi:hypothetical protein
MLSLLRTGLQRDQQIYMAMKDKPLYTTPPAAPVPLTDVYAQFNAAIDFAIEQRTEAAVFLRAWREGDTSEWPEFDAHGITKGQP